MVNLEQLIEVLKTTDPSLVRTPINTSDWTDEHKLDIFKATGKARGIDVKIDSGNRNCIIQLINWLYSDPKFKCLSPDGKRVIDGRFNKGIYLYGTTGTGKTMALSLLRSLASCTGLQYTQNSSQYSVRWNVYRADEIVDRYIHGDTLDSIKKEPIVCIEDLGSEPLEATYMGTRMNVLRTFLEQRGEYVSRLTLITSNIPLDSPDLQAKYGDRVVSRLCDMTNFLVMKGKDRRKAL